MYFLLYLSKSMETVRISDLTDFVEDYYLEELERHLRGSIFGKLSGGLQAQLVFRLVYE